MFRFVIALMICLATSAATARASGQAQGRLTPLHSGQFERLSPAIRAALESAKRACGDEYLSVRNGFLRHLRSGAGEELTAVHFDEVGCAKRAALCSFSGCLHRIFLTRAGSQQEVWRGRASEVDMSIVAGKLSIEVHCGDFGHGCCRQLVWTGSRFVDQMRSGL